MDKYKVVRNNDGREVYQVVYGELRECSCGCGPLAVDVVWFRSKERAERFDPILIQDPETPVVCRSLS